MGQHNDPDITGKWWKESSSLLLESNGLLPKKSKTINMVNKISTVM
ncbi:hypothetical protein GX618_00445 [Candidatus Dojkabacteria bacterium]|uniref:Uncharacterized protein n=1 Tax=Candidatus Dojkabacteria bacterium TaxID=2099670 RepID=A0A847ETU8_9BACT|nr:hypothetical protein [Candidatus Dojkabacteria bacterium]HRX44100.1 hypothetical protein [Candidatus Dojkabacteria bacterium]